MLRTAKLFMVLDNSIEYIQVVKKHAMFEIAKKQTQIMKRWENGHIYSLPRTILLWTGLTLYGLGENGTDVLKTIRTSCEPTANFMNCVAAWNQLIQNVLFCFEHIHMYYTHVL